MQLSAYKVTGTILYTLVMNEYKYLCFAWILSFKVGEYNGNVSKLSSIF